MELQKIINAVCLYKGLTEEQLNQKTRKFKISYPRQLIYYFSVLYTKEHKADIAFKVGNLDRNTVLHGFQTIREQKDTNRDVYKDVENLKILFQLFKKAEVLDSLTNTMKVRAHQLKRDNSTEKFECEVIDNVLDFVNSKLEK